MNAKTSADTLEGATIWGSPYLVEQRVGSGGACWVYRAKHQLFEFPVALKVLYDHLRDDPETVDRIFREARIQYNLQHPNIVRVLDVLKETYTHQQTLREENARVGLILEWVEGIDMSHFLASRSSQLLGQQLWQLMGPVVNAMAYAHNNNVIHRDLKPSNILLKATREGAYIPKVADFGLAKAARLSRFSGSARTKSGIHLGTPKYSSPEQINDTKRASYPSDVYNLGLILYELTTGRPPFDSEGYQIMYSHCYEEAPSPKQFNPQIPAPLEELILRCLKKSPHERYPNAGALYEALAQVLAHTA